MLEPDRSWESFRRRAAVLGVVIAGVLFITPSARNSVIRPTGVILHHSAISEQDNDAHVTTALLADVHKARGFRAFFWGKTYYIGYHYVVGREGQVDHGRPEHCLGAHAAGHNRSIGICLIGSFGLGRATNAPTPTQIDSTVRLIADILRRHELPITSFVRHSDVNPDTECPGAVPWAEMRARVEQELVRGRARERATHLSPSPPLSLRPWNSSMPARESSTRRQPPDSVAVPPKFVCLPKRRRQVPRDVALIVLVGIRLPDPIQPS